MWVRPSQQSGLLFCSGISPEHADSFFLVQNKMQHQPGKQTISYSYNIYIYWEANWWIQRAIIVL